MPPSPPPALTPADPGARERAFDALFRAHYPGLCRFAGRILCDSGLAEELVQDLFLYIWERLPVIDESTPSRAYLYRAAHNGAVNRLRHRAVQRRWAETEAVGEGGAGGAAEATAVQHLELAELEGAVRSAIERLPERCRLVYTLSRQDHLTYAEIAAALGLSVKTVEAQMTRAFRLLRRALAPYLASLLVVVSTPLLRG